MLNITEYYYRRICSIEAVSDVVYFYGTNTELSSCFIVSVRFYASAMLSFELSTQVFKRQEDERFMMFAGLGAGGAGPIINRKVAAAMVALSVYGLFLIIVSNQNININPVYVLTNIRNKYYIFNNSSNKESTSTIR